MKEERTRTKVRALVTGIVRSVAKQSPYAKPKNVTDLDELGYCQLFGAAYGVSSVGRFGTLDPAAIDFGHQTVLIALPRPGSRGEIYKDSHH